MTAKCVVSGMEIEVNDSTLRTIYNGKEYFFCCESCVDVFNENPEQYIENTL